MPDERKWYYAENKERKGPFDESVFIGMIKSGTLVPETLVWTKGFEKWRLLANTELSSHMEAEIPTPPDDSEAEVLYQTSPAPSVSHAPSPPPTTFPPEKQMRKSMAMKTRIGACLVVAITVLACLFIYASSDHKEERTSGSTVANIPTRSPSVENDENLSTDIAENAGTNVVAANSPAPAAMVHNDDSSPGIADEKWDTDVARPSRDKLTVFVLNKLIADGAKDFLDNFSMFIVPSRPDHAPEINLYLDTSVVEFQNEDCIEVLESLMWFVHEYLVENKMDVSEIQINGILQFDHETAGWGYLYDGVFDWTANDTPPAEAQTQVEVQAPPQQMETEETQITVSAESGARIISQPDSMGFFQYEKLCAGCNRPKFSGSAIKRRGATFGPFSDNSEMCTNCKTWNSARFRGY